MGLKLNLAVKFYFINIYNSFRCKKVISFVTLISML